jgi:hypothetical protein
MPTANEFAIIISAHDQSAQLLGNVERRLKSMSQPVVRTQRAFDELSKASGLTGVLRGTRDISRFSGEFLANLARAVPQASALSEIITAGGAAAALTGTAAALGELIKSSAEWGNQLKLLSIQSEVSTDDLQKIGNAAAAAGGDAKGAMEGTADLARNINLLMHTGKGSPEFMAGLQLLGVSLTDTNGKARTTSDVLNDILHRLAAIKDPQQRAYEGALVLGNAYAAWAPELNKGVAGLEAFQAQAAKMIRATPQQVDALQQLQQSFNILQGNAIGLGHVVAGELAPSITPIVNEMSAWLEKNKEWLAADIVSTIKEVAVDVKDVALTINQVVQALGGWKRAAEAVAVYMAVSKVFGFLAGVAGAVRAIRTIAGAFRDVEAAAGPASAAEAVAAAAGAGGAAEGVAGAAAGAAGGAAAGAETGGLISSIAAMGVGALRFLGPLGAFTAGIWPATANKNEDTDLEHYREKQAVQFFMQHGWTQAQAEGIVANLDKESRMHTEAVGDHGQAVGLAQWHPDRQAEFERLFHKPMQDASFDDQLAFVNWELNNTEGAAGKTLRQQTNAAGAGAAVSLDYERPANQVGEAQSRAGRAEQLDQILGTITLNTPNSPALPPAPQDAPATGAAPAIAFVPPTPTAPQDAPAAGAAPVINFVPPTPPAAAPPAAPVTTGAGNAASPANVNLSGGATLQVHLGGNVPSGTRTSVTTNGNVFTGAPTVVTPMPDLGGLPPP